MRKTKKHNRKTGAGTGACPYVSILLLAFTLFSGCGSSGGSDSSARFTINTPPFPEIQEMTSKVSVSLEIGGKVCPLTIDTDWTLSGQCSGIPTGTHSYTIKYQRTDLGVVIASASGSAALGSGTTITLPPLNKDLDDDGDGHSNLVEAMFETDPQDAALKPGVRPFSPLATYPTGSGPSSIALGHLNKDSFLDVVTADAGDDTVSVLLGNVDGTFKAAQSFAAGDVTVGPRVPVELALADLNADGNLDLVVVNSGEGGNHPGNLAVLLGNGDGSFQNAVPYATGNQPAALVLGDLNGDVLPDVVMGNFGSQDISVLPGKADGTFQTALASPILPPSALGDVTALALGKINADNLPDLVVSLQTAQAVKVLTGKGNGTFQSGSPISIPEGIIISVALKDLNGDTRLDLIAALASDKIAVLMGNGDGTFQARQFYNAGKTPGSLAFADLDGDGKLDLVTENEGEGLVALLRGKGDGTFRTPVFFEMGTSPSWIAVGDLNGDGGFDLFATDRASGNVRVLLTK